MRLLGCERGVPEGCRGGGIGLPRRDGGDKRPLCVGELVRGRQDLRGILGWEGERGGIIVDGCPARLPIVAGPVSGVDGSDS